MKDVVGYEGLYAITSCGKVWSYRSEKFLKPWTNGYGYWYVGLRKDGKVKKFRIHKLVAEAYIPNPQNLEDVDHIDGNTEHNYVNNLQWMTHADNLRKAHNKSVKCLETNEVFESATIAAEKMNLDKNSVSRVCRGKQKTTGRYHFEFV